jgi:hypothetical protein
VQEPSSPSPLDDPGEQSLLHLLSGLLDLVDAGEIEVSSPNALAMLRRIEGAVEVLSRLKVE